MFECRGYVLGQLVGELQVLHLGNFNRRSQDADFCSEVWRLLCCSPTAGAQNSSHLSALSGGDFLVFFLCPLSGQLKLFDELQSVALHVDGDGHVQVLCHLYACELE